MRTAFVLTFVVLTGTGGEICLTHAMKLLGEVHDFRPRAIASFVLRALRVGWLWIGVLLMTASFFSFLAMLSWFPVSFVVPATSLAYVAGRVRREDFPGRAAERHALGGNSVDLLRRGHGVGRRSAGISALASGIHVVRWAILALALGPLFYYLVGIYSAWRFFRVAHRVRRQAALLPELQLPDQRAEAGARTRSRRVRKLRQLLPAGISRIRNSVCGCG